MRSGSGRIRIWSASKIRSTEFGGELFLLLQGEGRQTLRGALGVEAVDKAEALQRMDAGRLGAERAVWSGKQGADARDLPPCSSRCERVRSNQFQLHSAFEVKLSAIGGEKAS